MRVKNWKQFQHFKDRCPPWIKLYRGLVDDPDWHELSAKDSKLLVMIWLIASEDKNRNGNLPCLKKLAFRLRIREAELKQALNRLSNWLISDDIMTISTGYQHDAPETETETETETDIRVCPHQKIIKLYNDILGETLTRVRPSLWTGSRKTNLKTRWNEFEERQSIDWWKRFFYSVKETPFLCGNSNGGWKADMGWIIKKENMIKIIEGKYKSGNDKDSPDWEKYCKN